MKNIFARMAVLTSFGQFLCIFCCIVPTATAILALLSTLGLAGANSMFLGDLSLMLHPYRGVIMGVSLFLISLSWALYFYVKKKEKMSCECASKKQKKPVFLIGATLLLTLNMLAIPFLH